MTRVPRALKTGLASTNQVAWALGAGDELTWRLYVAPASITRVEVTDRGVVLRTFNEASHLSGM